MSVRKNNWLKVLALILLTSSFPSVAFADWVDILSRFRPRISVMEEYTDNLDLTATNKREDFITTVYPGLSFSVTDEKEPKFGLDLDYLLGLVFYARNSQDNYISHTGTLNTWYTFGRNLTLRVWDSVVRSEEPEERLTTIQPQPGMYYLGVERQRSIYVRNVFEPSLVYQFGREDRFSVTYRNNYYQNESPTIEDSRANSVTPQLTYWFNVHNGITLEYGFTSAEFEISPDFIENRARARYTYRFNPRTSIFGEYTFDTYDYASPGIDFTVHSPSIGITHAFTPTLSGRAQAGYFRRIPDQGKATDGLTVDLGLTQRSKRTTYDLTLQGGYTYDFITAENLGFTKYYRAIGNISYQLAARVSTSLVGSVERDEFIDSDRRDWLWRVGGDISYQVLKWLSASLGVSYRDNNSNQNTFDYQEFRATVRLTAAYR